jgi:galactonate dehydratase
MAPRVTAQARRVDEKWLQVVRVDRTPVKLPFRPTPARNMARELPHWQYFEIVEVELKSGHVGRGESMLYYTWRATSDEAVQQVLNQNAADWMWRNSVGAGLQIALFDAVARTAEVPIHRLLGAQVRDRAPLAWWNIDTYPEDMASECALAYRQGYRSYKTKGRPWFDIWKQVELTAAAVPESFKVAIDFNDTLLDADRGIPILKELQAYPQVAIWESPIPQNDVAGNRRIREETGPDVAMHFGNPRPATVVREEACDGFVIGGDAQRVLQQGNTAALLDMPFWLQQVGSGITAAWSLHFAAVLSHATWPAVNCHQLYEHSLLATPIEVVDGTTAIPSAPGLGYELDQDAMARFRVEKPAERPEPPRLLETSYPDGRKQYVANTGQVDYLLRLARRGRVPYYERGVTTNLVPDDGSSRWRALYDQARTGPVLQR